MEKHIQEQNRFPDKEPKLREVQLVLLVMYLLLYPFSSSACWIAFFAGLSAIMRKGGYIEFNTAYLQRIMFSDAFINLTYVISISGCNKNLFINSPIIISAIQVLSRDFKQILVAKPQTPILSICYLQPYIYKASASSFQSQLNYAKGLLEVYAAIMIIVSFFFRNGNGFLSIVSFCQLMKFRYTLSLLLQTSFTKVNYDFKYYLSHPMIPDIVKNKYTWATDTLHSFVAQQVQVQGAARAGGNNVQYQPQI